MIFIPILIIAIALYFTGKRILSVMLFFFFLSNGYQIIPPFLFDTGFGISKSMDFALVYVLAIFFIGLGSIKNFIIKNKLATSIWIFTAFIIISIGISKYHFGVSWVEIARTARYFFFVLGYFVFRRLDKTDLIKILNYNFSITLILCIIYIIQVPAGTHLLTGATTYLQIGTTTRFYNIPTLYYFFLPYAMFANPLKGKQRIISIVLFVLVTIVSMHRGHMLALFGIAILGIYISQGGFKGFFKYILIGSICMLPVLNIIIDRFEDKTSKDINSVMMGAFKEYGDELAVDGTFLFRMALLYERFDYIIQDPLQTAVGVGFMTEDSPLTKQKFDFKIGLMTEDHEVTQLDTSDIAWMNFILRLGLIGTILYLYIFFVLGKYFFKNRKDDLSLTAFLYIIFLVALSISSSVFYDTWMIIPAMICYVVVSKKDNYEDEDVNTNLEIQEK